MAEFSVVIPTYNREKTIIQAVSSVLEQKNPNSSFGISEIIIVDDCSDDNTEAVIESFAEKEAERLEGCNTKIIYHRLPQNSGPGKARNEGAKLAKSEFIAFQDSDDYWLPEKLMTVAEFIEANPMADIYCHFYEAHLDGGRTITVDAPDLDDYFEELAVRNLVGAPAIVVRRDAFMDVGGFDENMRALEDWDFALRFAYKHSIRFVPQVLMEVDLTGEGVSSKAGNYYDARCRIIAGNKDILIERGVFKKAVEKLLSDAQEKGIMKEIAGVLELYLRT